MPTRFCVAPRLVWLAAVALLLGGAGCAVSNPTIETMRGLNSQALHAYAKGQPAEARGKLIKALALAQERGLDNDEVTARTRLHLGIVYAGGLKQRSKAIEQMARALSVDPSLELPAMFANGPVKRAFAAAQKQAGQHQPAPAPKVETREASASQTPRNRAKVQAQVAAKAETKADTKPNGNDARPPRKGLVRAEASDEPDLPATIPQPVYCPSPDEAPPGVDLPLLCVLQPAVRAAHVTLYYRPPSVETYEALSMTRTPKGWYSATIPGAAVAGKLVQFYVEAESTSQRKLAANGDSGSPNLVLVRDGAAPASTTSAAAPPEGGPKEADEPADEPPLVGERDGEAKRGAGTWWLGVELGTGQAWHPSGHLEASGLPIGSGIENVGLLHLLPEVGYQWSDRVAYSAELRYQFIPKQGSGDLSPATSAWAVLGRATYFVGKGIVQGFAAAAVGGGSGFRLVIAPDPMHNLNRNDTLRGGPVLVGGGLGALIHFGPTWSGVLELRSLVGVPDFAVLGEVNGGVQFAF